MASSKMKAQVVMSNTSMKLMSAPLPALRTQRLVEDFCEDAPSGEGRRKRWAALAASRYIHHSNLARGSSGKVWNFSESHRFSIDSFYHSYTIITIITLHVHMNETKAFV